MARGPSGLILVMDFVARTKERKLLSPFYEEGNDFIDIFDGASGYS